MKYFIKTFGCQMNKADSEKIAGWYKNRGFRPAKKLAEAEEIVINTCSVRQSAEDRVYGVVNNLIKLKGPTCHRLVLAGRQNSKRKTASQNSKIGKPKIILTGCMLRYPLRWLREKMPQVDEFKRIREFTPNSRFDNLVTRNSKIHAWVPIMEGCDNFCTYCVVPYARGRERSRPFDEIICEVEELAKRGYKEITLLGQNVNSYGKDLKNSKFKIQNSKLSFDPELKTEGQSKIKNFKTPFAKLLAAFNEVKGLEKVKFLTSNPWDLTDDIIEAIKLPKIDRYLHLPVQSGDDEILKRMNRKYKAAQYLSLVRKIRQKIPEIEIGTDIIVGFPGETEKQFQHTVDLCKKVGFKVAYIAMYSPRPQTAAYKLKDDMPYQEKKRRWEILEALVNRPH